MYYIGIKKPTSAGRYCVYVFACLRVYMHAPRDMSDLSGTGTSQGTTAVEIQFSTGDRRGSRSVTA